MSGGIDAAREWYLDVSKWLCLEVDDNASPVTSKREREILLRAMQEKKDEILKNGIEAAMREYFLADRDNIDNDRYCVEMLPVRYTGSNYYKVELKETKEFAIFESFMFDDGREKHAYYRSDETFGIDSAQRLHY